MAKKKKIYSLAISKRRAKSRISDLVFQKSDFGFTYVLPISNLGSWISDIRLRKSDVGFGGGGFPGLSLGLWSSLAFRCSLELPRMLSDLRWVSMFITSAFSLN